MKKIILLCVFILITSCNFNNDNYISNIDNTSLSNNDNIEQLFYNNLQNNRTTNDSNENRDGYLMISVPQTQVHYNLNDKLNLDNIKIHLIYTDDYSQEELNIKDIAISSVDLSTSGIKKVEFVYGKFKGSYLIYVGKQLEIPSNISIDSLNNKVSWNKVTNASKYQVKISDYEKEYGTYEVENTSFNYSQYDLLPGDYRFEVKSLSNDANYYDSDYSTFIKIHVKAEGELEPLTKPSGLNDNVVSFSWNSDSLVNKWIITIYSDTYSDEFELDGSINKIIYKDNSHFNNLESGTYSITIKAIPKDTSKFSESSNSSYFKILEEGEKVKLGTPFGFVDAGSYAMLGYLANAKTFGVKIYTEENVFIKEVEIEGLGFNYKNDLELEPDIYVLYIYAKGYDVFTDSDLLGPCKINYVEE